MLTKSKYLLFIPLLIAGSIMAVSASSWFSAWIGLEINLMSFAPILINNSTFQSVEAAIKYFLVQALSSTILIFFIFLPCKLNFFNLNIFMETVMTLTLLLKAGVAPLHFWFPQVMAYSSWMQCLIILTWQKLAPFILMSFLNNNLIILSVCSSATIGALGAINQTSMKKIITYSSINHSAWMLGLTFTNDTLWLLYFMTYTFLTFSVIYLFAVYNFNYLSAPQMIKMPPASKLITVLNFFSLAGIPPMLGFLAKLLAIITLIKAQISSLVLLILIFSSFLALYFYLRVLYTSLLINYSAHFFIHSTSSTKINFLCYCSISFLGSFLLPLMILLT